MVNGSPASPPPPLTGVTAPTETAIVERRAGQWNSVGLAATLADLVAAPGPLTDTWRDLGERAFADTVGVLVAGAADPAVYALAATLDETGGPARSVATGASLSTRSAALLDGTAAHALDYDDVDDAIIGHPSAVLVPALLAAGGRDERTGDAVLDAFRVGVEAGRAVAAAMDVRAHYEQGWHTTGTIGALAATAALARLTGLDDDAARRALGVAGSLAAGSRQNFGTETKPLHAGVAASTGVLAVRLAAGGFTADPDQLDGPLGYLALHAARPATPVPARSDDEPPGLNVKLYPCCYYLHSAAEAAIELGHKIDDLASVTRVEAVVQPGGLAPLIHHRPVDGTQAKFSLEYSTAACLTDRALTFASFTQDAVGRAPVRELMARVEIREDPVPPVGPPTDGPFAVMVVHAGDAALTARVDHAEGHATRPVSWPRLREKFDDCVPGCADDAWDGLRHLRAVTSVRGLVDDLAGAARVIGLPPAARRRAGGGEHAETVRAWLGEAPVPEDRGT